jgi:hypothetical protein
MSGAISTEKNYSVPQMFYTSPSLNAPAGTYDLFSSLADCILYNAVIWNGRSASGLTSITIKTNETTPTSILGTTLLSTLSGNKNLTPYTTPLFILNGKKIQLAVDGTGTEGDLTVGLEISSFDSGQRPVRESREATATFTADLCQTAATYDLATATGDLVITNIDFTVTNPGGTLITSVTFVDDNSSPDTLLATTLAADLIDGATLTAYATQTTLANGKKIQYVIDGDGSADVGTEISVVVTYLQADGVSIA